LALSGPGLKKEGDRHTLSHRPGLSLLQHSLIGLLPCTTWLTNG
jgi:hypothetical protein